jgi:hypothetical protein
VRRLILQSHAQLGERLDELSAQMAHIGNVTEQTHAATARIEQGLSVQGELVRQILRASGVSREVWFIRGLLLALIIVLVVQLLI